MALFAPPAAIASPQISTPSTTAPSGISSPQWLVQYWPTQGKAQTLAHHQADVASHPASITKLLTAYVCLKAIQAGEFSLDSLLPITLAATQQEGMRVGYRVDERIRLQDALQGMLAISGNDAAWAIAEHISGSVPQFAARMNAMSASLGLTHSQWQNPHGLTQENHLSSVNDVAKLSHALWQEFPDARPWLSVKTYRWAGVDQSNRNSLLWRDPMFDGLKTGHTQAAGYNLAATSRQTIGIESDVFEWRISSVLMGASSSKTRADESAALHQWARQHFVPWRLYSANERLGAVSVKGAVRSVNVHALGAVWVLLHEQKTSQNLRFELHALESITAPIQRGQAVAYFHIYEGNHLLHRVAAHASEPLPRASWLDIAWHWVKSLF